MRRTIIKIEFEEGLPLDIEITGRQLTNKTERAIFYIVVALLALGTVWAVLYIIFPLLWFILKLLFWFIVFGFIVLGVILVVTIVLALIKWQFDKRRKDDFWEDDR